MVQLPDDFQFSQSSLQDYVDCPARFELRHIGRRNYPAPQSEPLAAFERHMRQGERFHTLVHQHLVGIDADAIAASLDDDLLAAWWSQYAVSEYARLPGERFPEVSLSAPLGRARIVAKYDVVVLHEGRATIIDWKTSQRRPKRETLARRLQTIIYRYLLVEAGAALNGGQPIAPEAVTMTYWFAGFPHQPEHFPYDAAQHRADGEYLTALARDILARDDFPLTDDVDRCRFCTYRSLHDRGEPGDFFSMEADDPDVDYDIDFTLDQIAEIEF